MTHSGLSERHALRVIGMSASSYRYAAAADKNQALREQIVALAQRHRRYGSSMIYLKLRQSGLVVNHKRVERLYAQENLQVRRRKRKKVPASERQPLGRPSAANQMWSMDFVFDRTAEGRVIKNLTVMLWRLFRSGPLVGKFSRESSTDWRCCAAYQKAFGQTTRKSSAVKRC